MSQVSVDKHEVVVRRIPAVGTRELRHRVLWHHKPSPEECVIDIDEAQGALHLGAFVEGEVPWGIVVPGFEGRLIGACSLFDQHLSLIHI